MVSYMHQVLNMPLSAALASFEAARHPGLFHAPYIQDLFKRFGKGEPAPQKVAQGTVRVCVQVRTVR